MSDLDQLSRIGQCARDLGAGLNAFACASCKRVCLGEARKMLGTTPDQLRLPANEHTWLMYNMGFGTDLSDDKEDVVAEVERRIQQLECLSIPNLYQCGKCEWVV